jgi:hypothetical protein
VFLTNAFSFCYRVDSRLLKVGPAAGGASSAFGMAYEALASALPPEHRIDLDVRQFVFWLRPTADFFGPSAAEAEADGGESATEAAAAEVVGREATEPPVVDAGGPVMAVAVVTSAASSARLPRLALTWASPAALRALLPAADWPAPRGFSAWIQVVAVSDEPRACPGPPPAWVRAAAAAASGDEAVVPETAAAFAEGERARGVEAVGDDGGCVPTVACVQCGGSKLGIPCRSWCALKVVKAAFPRAQWYLRLMDDTLVRHPHLLPSLEVVFSLSL